MCPYFRAVYSSRARMKTTTPIGGNVEFLLVEENPADITLTLNTLKKASVFNKIHVLREGSQVMDFIFSTGPFINQPPISPETLILLSLNLTGIHGLDLLRRIKSDQRTKSFPVIILTSSQEERGVMQSYKLGANACIVKPVDLPKFVEAVAELRLGWLLISPQGTGSTTAPRP